jgi:hypothetical protein
MSTSTSKSISGASFASPVLRVAAVPPLALATFALLLGLGVPPVPEWFWPTPTTNVAEAAVLGDAARVRALAAAGASIDAAHPVRREFRVDGDPAVMTPLEGAMRRGHDELVQLLLELGATPPADATAGAP